MKLVNKKLQRRINLVSRLLEDLCMQSRVLNPQGYLSDFYNANNLSLLIMDIEHVSDELLVYDAKHEILRNIEYYKKHNNFDLEHESF